MARARLSQTATLESMTRLGDERTAMLESPSAMLEKAGKEPTTPASELKGRGGYDASFLSGWKIPFPKPKGKALTDARKIGSSIEIKYTHFSVVLSKSRKMTLFGAVNIDGAKSRRIARTPIVWAFDGRISEKFQWGDALYDNNDLDRGHMVRREDPVWGTMAEANQANEDTFHFTNSCPQMAGVNQHIWLGLEDYVLKHARADKMRVSVFTGPFFTKKDLKYRDALVPLSFWKVVAIVTDDGRPSATAYRVSQEKELSELEFVYAGYQTFQISIQQVIDGTGIDFSGLAKYDGFSVHESTTGEQLVERIDSLENIRV